SAHRFEPCSRLYKAIIGKRNGGRIKAIRLDDVGAGFEIGCVNLCDRLRLSDAQKIIATLQGPMVICVLLTPEILLIESQALDHRPHRSIEKKDSLGWQSS